MRLENKLISDLENYKDIAFDLNYYLAENPETAAKEFKSSKKIVNILNNNNIKTSLGTCDIETAFFGKVIDKGADINIGILTEYDALPDVGHACGHSASASISVLSALALKANEDLINANVDIIGTPGEEGMGLKSPMADSGMFDKYDFVIMVHMFSGKSEANHKFMANSTIDIEFSGKPAHAAASPWDGRSALDGLMLSIHAFDMMRKFLKPGCIIEGIILEGGVATNVIPERAIARYKFRAIDKKIIDNEIKPWAIDILEGCAKATGTRVEIKQHGYEYANMIFNETGTRELEGILDDLGIERVKEYNYLASSDIGNVSYRCPAFHPMLAITSDNAPLHSKELASLVKSKKSEDAIINGAKIILSFISRMVESPTKIEEIKKEFKRTVKK